MKFITKLEHAWQKNKSLVCVGLDPLIEKMPKHIQQKKNPMFEFCKAIVDSTANYACTFKIQIAYFSSQRAEQELEDIIAYIHENYPDIPVILDAKRSDIANTAEQYAIEAFDRYKANALTVVPFQGPDAMKPYLDRADKGIVILCRTSNPGAAEMQDILLANGEPVYQHIAHQAASEWNYNNNIALVVGATRTEELKQIRNIIGDMPILVPGIGAQGGSLESSVLYGKNSKNTGLMISASRSIIYAASGEDFADAAQRVVCEMNAEIKRYL
jgi:orotidine-5'-phosphate decarboxylase